MFKFWKTFPGSRKSKSANKSAAIGKERSASGALVVPVSPPLSENKSIHETSTEKAEKEFIKQSTKNSIALAEGASATFDYERLHEILNSEFSESRKREDSDKKFLRNDTIYQQQLTKLFATSSLSAMIFDSMTQAFIFYLRDELNGNKLEQLLQEYYKKLESDLLIQRYVFEISSLKFSNPEIQSNMIRSLFYLIPSPQLCLQTFIKSLPVELTAKAITFAAKMQQFFLLTAASKEENNFKILGIDAKKTKELITREQVFVKSLFSQYGEKFEDTFTLDITNHADPEISLKNDLVENSEDFEKEEQEEQTELTDSNITVFEPVTSTKSVRSLKNKKIGELIQFFNDGAPCGIYSTDDPISVNHPAKINP